MMPTPFEWVVVDREKRDYKIVNATEQREAALKGLNKYNLRARDTHDVHPRTGDRVLMDREDFRKFAEREIL